MKRKVKIPALKLKCRILLYVVTILFAVFAIMNAATGIFPKVIGIVTYVLAAGSLFFACFYIVSDVRLLTNAICNIISHLMDKNQWTRRLFCDYRYRTVVFTAGGLLLNLIFAVFNCVIGIASRSAWYVTLAAYYFMLTVMRFGAVNYEKRVSRVNKTEVLKIKEIRVYRNCSILLLIMTIVLGGMVILTVHSQGGKHYPGVTIYIIALYTFIKIPLAMAGRVKVGKMKSPLLVTIRSIGYADACVAILSLQTAMFASFGNRKVREQEAAILMNEITGAVICVMVLGMGIYGIYSAKKMKRQVMNGEVKHD